ncbi:MAG: hypothetical protein FJ296_10000 [Planctomycetes bacterium]|nr:hypothetical protein [Planctomycetota bacterium]
MLPALLLAAFLAVADEPPRLVPGQRLEGVGRGRLKANKGLRVKLHVTLPNGLKKPAQVSLVQLHGGQVVGRMTWRLKPKPAP